MARQASDLTLAIRKLSEESNFEITHTEGRVKLAKLGFELATEPNANKTEDVKLFEEKFKEMCEGHEYDVNNEAHVEALQVKAAKALGIESKLKTILKEIGVREAYKAERNNFDVTKYNWRKALESGSATSIKPKTSTDTKAKVAAKHSPKAAVTIRAPKQAKKVDDVAAGLNALAYVEANGGIAACKQKLQTLKDEATALEATINLFETLKHRMEAA